jgi:hypothetical protein
MDKFVNKDGESFFERLNQLWESRGVKSEEWGYRSAWIMKFGKFIAPRRFYQAELGDVEAFYGSLVSENRRDKRCCG